jgi:amidase
MQDHMSAVDLVHRVRAGELRAVDVVDAALARAADDRCNAVVTISSDRARSDARAVDRAIADGRDPGPLAGVPFTAKDTIATAGVRTTAGSRLLADHIPERDAPCVARLRNAGAVLVGKTNCPEFALQAHTDNLVFGTTTHPQDTAMSPGGSSGGCAAAVATGIVPVSIGGDYGGSIRYPAGCTGSFGLRPTRGAIDAGGTLPAPAPGTPRHRFQEVGPITRAVADIAAILSVLRNGPSLGGAVTRVGLVLDGWPIDDHTRRALEQAAAALTVAGVAVHPVDATPFARATDVFDAWRATDDYADLHDFVGRREADLSAHIRSLLEPRRAPAPPGAVAAIAREAEELERVVAGVLEHTPVLMLPIALVGALPIGAELVNINGRTEPLDSLRILAPSRAISLLGLPALAVPVGVDHHGLPVGVQLVARPHAEADLFSVAESLGPTR